MFKRLLLLLNMLLLMGSIFGVNDKIYSQGNLSAKTLASFLLLGNNQLGDELVNEFATIYIEEAAFEGINWDVAFVQMCLETGFLNFGGLVTINQNNFCGLGSFDNNKGAEFPTIREGVRAHIQHLKAYSTTDNLKGALLDPRFHFVERGSALTVKDLAGKWATDPDYGIKLLSLLERINYLEIPSNDDIAIGSEIIKNPIVTEVNQSVEYIADKSSVNNNLTESSSNEKITKVEEYSKETAKEKVAKISEKKSEPYKVVIGGGWVR